MMCRIIYGIFLFLFFAMNLHAQKVIIGNDNSILSFSNGINNSFTNKLLLSRFIGREEINSNKLKSTNYFFGEFNSSLFCTYFSKGAPEKPSAGLHFSLSHRTLVSASFNKDAHHLIFEGNAAYADKIADLSGMALQRLSYQMLEGGYFKAEEIGNWYYYGYAGVGFVKGQQKNNLSLERFTLYTQPDAEYLDINTKLNYTFCEQGKSIFAFNGAGAALHLKAIVKNKEKDWQIELEAKDAGFIKWTNTSQQANFDSSFRFDGIPVSLLSSEISNTILGDSLSNLLSQHIVPYRKTTMIPARFFVSFGKKVNEKISFSTGLSYYAYSGMRFPLSRFDFQYSVNSNLHLTALLRYGFYNNLNVGMAIDYKILSTVTFQLNVLNIPAFIVPSKTSSQGLFFAVLYHF